MATDSISVISVDCVIYNGPNEEKREVEENNKVLKGDTSAVRAFETSANDEIQESSENESKSNTIENTVSKTIRKIVFHSIAVVGISILFVAPWTTIPRTNSIIYQSYWMEVLIPSTTNWMTIVAADLLNLTIWTQERSVISPLVFLKLYFVYSAPPFLLYILSYMIWCVYLGYNHPLPHVMMVTMLPTQILTMISLWFVLPSSLLEKGTFRRKLRIYMVYCLWTQATFIQNEVLSFLFSNVPINFQFLVPFLVAACRELDKRVRSKMVDRMMGQQDQPAKALISITISATYGFFFAIRLAGATSLTVFCVLAIDFFLHSRITYKLIKENKKVNHEVSQNGGRKKYTNVTMLILAELMEGFTPMIYAICMAMAYYGVNAELFINIRSTFWGRPIENINKIFITMGILFAVDTVSVIVNSTTLWKVMNVNMVREFAEVLGKYWYFIVIKQAYQMSFYFAGSDVNFGNDFSGKFEWITPEGRLNLVYNSTDLSEEEKSEFFLTSF